MFGQSDRSSSLLDLLEQAGTPPSTDSERELSTFEAMVLAVLDEELSPRGARALEELELHGLLDAESLAECDPRFIPEFLGRSGLRITPRQARSLQRVAHWFAAQPDNVGTVVESRSTTELRDQLLALNGIGPATADRILLWGLNRPTYPVDRGSYRIAARHGWIDEAADYEDARSSLERIIPDDAGSMRRASQGLRWIARQFCRVGTPQCERCPLGVLLGPEGPRSLWEAGD